MTEPVDPVEWFKEAASKAAREWAEANRKLLAKLKPRSAVSELAEKQAREFVRSDTEYFVAAPDASWPPKVGLWAKDAVMSVGSGPGDQELEWLAQHGITNFDGRLDLEPEARLCPTCGAYWKCGCPVTAEYLREVFGLEEPPSHEPLPHAE